MIEQHGEADAPRFALDVLAVQQDIGNHIRFLILDAAEVHTASSWMDAKAAESRGIPKQSLLNRGVVAASDIERAFREGVFTGHRGVQLVQVMSRVLLNVCMCHTDLSRDQNEARQDVMKDRRPWPVASFAYIEASPSRIAITQVGDVFVARNGTKILGAESAIDQLKSDLKQYAMREFPNIDANYFYHLIYNGKAHTELLPASVDGKEFSIFIIQKVKRYCLERYPIVTAQLFDKMIAEGMTTWQRKCAQNNGESDFCIPVLDPVGDTPKERMGYHFEGIKLDDPPRYTIYTDGLVPKDPNNVSIHTLEPASPFAEMTAVEIDWSNDVTATS